MIGTIGHFALTENTTVPPLISCNLFVPETFPCFTNEDFEKLEGIILNDEDDVTIVGINRLRPWTRQRYSAAHEYCHFIKDLKNIQIK